jgi:hypothetical protein
MADTNGRTSAQIEYTVQRAEGAPRVRETSVDIVNGQLEKLFRGRTSEVRFRNYLQIAGVRGGENQLRLRLERSGRTRVERVEVFGDSGVFRTSRSPYPLRLMPRLAAARSTLIRRFASSPGSATAPESRCATWRYDRCSTGVRSSSSRPKCSDTLR